MRTMFMGIEIARRALQAQQRSLEVVGHNIANANTPGYSRQLAVHRASRPLGGTGMQPLIYAGQVGTGVVVGEIARMRDAFVDAQLRDALQAQGEWMARGQTLSQLEQILLEPTGVGLRNDFDQFWQALQNLHLHPDNEAERAVVRERALALTSTFQHLYQRLEDLRYNLDQELRLAVEAVNAHIAEIGELNRLIRQVTNAGMNPNDLMDRRDLILRELSELTQLGVFEEPNGTVRVTIAGMTVVDEWGDTRRFVTEGNPPFDWTVVRLEGSSHEVRFRGGKLAAIMAMRDEQVPKLQEHLDELAKTFADEFNEIHRQGFDLDGMAGEDFFVYATGSNESVARTITVNPTLLDPITGLNKIAAGWYDGYNPGDPVDPGDPVGDRAGNGENALRLARLRTEKFMSGGTATVGEYWASVIGGLGVDAQKARQMIASQEVVVGHLEMQREEMSGVSLDEEMANMVRYQHAYHAAARMMTAVDDMLETVILRMGLVGR